MKRRCYAHLSTARAFTLLEVIIGIALLGVMTASMFTFLSSMLTTRARVRGVADRELAVSLFFDRLEGALAAGMVGDSTSGSGVNGGEESIALLTRGVAALIADRGPSDPRLLSDLQRAVFTFDRGTGVLRGSYTPGLGASVPAATREDVFGPIERIRFRYHDGSAWVDSFDSLELNRLPLAIEVAVWFAPWSGGGDDAIDGDESAFEEVPLNASEPYPFVETAPLDDDEVGRVPRPDRIRVFVIPDPDPGDASEAVEFDPVDSAREADA
jgi:prepilin-type N-terminal cleavage/methylation domain-containing protein